MSYDEALASLIDSRFSRTELRERVSVGGRTAFRLELVATGEGLAERGTRTYAYLFRGDGGPPVLVQTTARPGERIRHRDVVDHAASTLRLFPPAAEHATSTLPEPVEEMRTSVLAAAQARDYDALAGLADPDEFSYTFGGPVEGGPAEYWRSIEADERPLEMLATILQLPYTLAQGIYVWPFAFDKSPGDLTEYERELLEPLGSTFAGDSYLGWRAGITPDGRWIYFIAGD